MNLTVEVAERAGGWIVTATGEIDVHTAGALRDALVEAEAGVAGQGLPIVVDLTRVPFMDSTGLGVLVGALARSRENDRRLVLVGATDRIGRLLRLTGLDGQFDSAADVDAVVGPA